MWAAPVEGELRIVPGITQLYEMSGYVLSTIAQRIDPEIADAAGRVWRGHRGQPKSGAQHGEQVAFGGVAK